MTSVRYEQTGSAAKSPGSGTGSIYQAPAEKFFKDWWRAVKRSKLEPLKKVADMLANRLWGLLNYLKHRITNAASEGMNSLVARVIANARGLRSFRTLRVRVLFFLGKLDLTV